MKPSHLQTPRTLADCTFTQGYESIQPMIHKEPVWQFFGSYGFGFAMGVVVAALIVAWWSA